MLSDIPGSKDTLMITNKENPLEPSGIFVLMIAMAETCIVSSIDNCRAPAYSPLSGSNKMKPPPFTIPASIERPTPFGGRKPISNCTGPRLPLLPAGNEKIALAPISCIATSIGPNLPVRLAARPIGIFPLSGFILRLNPSNVIGPNCICKGRFISKALLPPI